MQSKVKSRNLSVYEFFQILQEEWLTAELRSRLYPKSYKAFWDKVKEGKGRIINEIAEKNHLPTIFTDNEMRHIFERKMYGIQGLPIFCYKNEEDRIKQEPLDLTYYFAIGTEVRCEEFDEQKIGIIKSYQPYSSTISITIAEQVVTCDVKMVTRIL